MVSKTLFDYFIGGLLFIILILPIILIWFFCYLDTGENGFFTQDRIGKNSKVFKIYKFRTIKGVVKSYITTKEMNISKYGSFLRRYGIDEIPQLINILNGTMSFVGPRPDVPGYADKLTGDDTIILSVKPGITGPAQLKYKNEIEILSKVENPKEYNDSVLWKDKVQINKHYVKNISLKNDIYYIIKTII